MPSLPALPLVDFLTMGAGRLLAAPSSSDDEDELDEDESDCQAAFCKAVRTFPVLPLLMPKSDPLCAGAGLSVTNFLFVNAGRDVRSPNSSLPRPFARAVGALVVVEVPLVDGIPLVVGFDGAPVELLLLLGGKGNSSGGGMGKILVPPPSELLSMIGL